MAMTVYNCLDSLQLYHLLQLLWQVATILKICKGLNMPWFVPFWPLFVEQQGLFKNSLNVVSFFLSVSDSARKIEYYTLAMLMQVLYFSIQDHM